MKVGPGLFGKSPETGDFLSRALSQPIRHALDLWVTRNVAVQTGDWPEGGLRGILDLGSGHGLFLALPSADKVGRRFPLVAVTDGQGLSHEIAEAWCDAMLPFLLGAASGENPIDDVLIALKDVEPSARVTGDCAPALWTAGKPPIPCDGESVAQIFSSG